MAIAALVHGLSFASEIINAIEIMNAHFVTYSHPHFDGLRFYTCANMSEIFEECYLANCKDFILRPTLISAGNVKITGIVVMRNAIGTVCLEIPFLDLDFISDVDFLVLKEPVPTLL